MLQRTAVAVSLVAMLFLGGNAFAANGGGANKTSSTSSISAPVVVSTAPSGAFSADSTTSPRYGDVITFNVSTTQTSSAFVNLNCYQGGTLVAVGWEAFFAGGTPGEFGLYGNSWPGGAADCKADLGMFASNGKWKVLASSSFHVDA